MNTPTAVELKILKLFQKVIDRKAQYLNITTEDHKDDDNNDPIDIFEFFERFKKIFWKAQLYNLNLEHILAKALEENNLLKIRDKSELTKISSILKTLKEHKFIHNTNIDNPVKPQQNTKQVEVIKPNTKTDIDNSKNNIFSVLGGIKTLIAGIPSNIGKAEYIKLHLNDLKIKWEFIDKIFNKIKSIVKSILPKAKSTGVNISTTTAGEVAGGRGNTRVGGDNIKANKDNDKSKDISNKQKVGNDGEAINNNKTVNELIKDHNANSINDSVSNRNKDNNRDNGNSPLARNPDSNSYNPPMYGDGGNGNYAGGENDGNNNGVKNKGGRGNDLDFKGNNLNDGNSYTTNDSVTDNDLGNTNTQAEPNSESGARDDEMKNKEEVNSNFSEDKNGELNYSDWDDDFEGKEDLEDNRYNEENIQADNPQESSNETPLTEEEIEAMFLDSVLDPTSNPAEQPADDKDLEAFADNYIEKMEFDKNADEFVDKYLEGTGKDKEKGDINNSKNDNNKNNGSHLDKIKNKDNNKDNGSPDLPDF